MSKYTVIGLCILLLSMIGFGFFYLNYKNTSSAIQVPSAVYIGKQSTQSNQSSSESFNPPTQFGSPGVASVWITYVFSGKIKEIKKLNSITEIILDVPNPQIPSIMITKDTSIFKGDATSQSPMSADLLKWQMGISVNMTFDVKTRQWTTRNIFVANNEINKL